VPGRERGKEDREFPLVEDPEKHDRSFLPSLRLTKK